MGIFNKITSFYNNNIRKSYDIGELYQSKGLSDSDRKWGAKNFLNANEISLYTNRAIAKRAEKVGETEFVLRNQKGEEVENEITKLLENPNPMYSGPEFFELYQKQKDLTGSVYVLLSGDKEGINLPTKIKSMWVMPTVNMREIYDDNGTLVRYEYDDGSKTRKYDPSLIICSKYYNPKNPKEGMSLLQAGAYAISTETQLNQYHSNILENGGKIDGVFSFDANLTKHQLQEVKQEYSEKYSEAKKSGMPLFMGGNAKYERVSASPEELSFLESKKTTLNDICMMTGVPKVLLAMFDEMKYDNAENAIRMFLKETIHPLLSNIVYKFSQNGYITQNKYYLDFIDPVPENKEELRKDNENGIQNYYLTPNEARENMGYDPINGGDDLLVPMNLMPNSGEKVKKK